MIEQKKFIAWMAALTDRFGRALHPGTQQAYYAQLSPLLSTEEFDRAASLVFRDETFWPSPRVFIEKVRSNAPPLYRALPPGASGRNLWPALAVFDKASERDAECACGQMYVQYLFSIPWLEELSEGARRAILEEFRQGACPTECPSCARKILASGISYPERPRQRDTPEWAA